MYTYTYRKTFTQCAIYTWIHTSQVNPSLHHQSKRHFSALPAVEVPTAGVPHPTHRLNSVREITIGIVLGLGMGLLWKRW